MRLVRLCQDLACWVFFTGLLAIVMVPAVAIALVCWFLDEDDYDYRTKRDARR